MSNFFAALDDSGDEAEFVKKNTRAKKEKKAEPPQAPVAEPSKPEKRRQRHDDRNTKSGRGRPVARDGKRAYDRRSGTGRGKETKKGGGGAHNWGSDKNVAKQNTGAVDEKTLDEADKKEIEAETAAEEPKAEEVEPVKEEEPEDNTMTYEEYLASKKAADSGLLAKKTQEKELVNEFEGKVGFKAKDDADFLVMGTGKAVRKRPDKKDKVTLTPAFRVGDANKRPGRDNRDGRERKGGRDRRGGGRGGRGDQKKKTVEINTADAEAFPSL